MLNTQNNQKKENLIPEEIQPVETPEDKIFHNLMERVGSFGKYQVSIFVIWCILRVIFGGIMFVTPFVYYQDPYDCLSANLPSGTNCNDYVCGLPPSQRQQFIPKPLITSLVNKFGDYRCSSGMNTVNLVQTLMYSGIVIAIVLLSLFGNFISKKNIILFNSILILIGVIIASFSVSLVMGGVGLFFCNFGGMFTFNLSYIYVIETFGEKHRKTFAMALPASYSLGSLLNVLWFYVIPDFKIVLLCFYGIPAVIAIILLIIMVRDVPIDLITKKSPEKAFKALQFIAKVNSNKNFTLTLQQFQEIRQKYKKSLTESMEHPSGKRNFSILDLFRYKSLRTMTLLLAFIDISINLEYFTPSLMISQFNFSIYINGLVVQSAEFLSGVVSCFIINCIPRRVLAITSFSIVFVCSFILIFIWDQDNQSVTNVEANIFVLLLVFVLEFAVTTEFNFFVIYITELYPTQVRVIGNGLVQIFGSAVLLVAEQIISGCFNSGFRIMILFALMGGLSVVSSVFLPQSFGKVPPDIIEELKKGEEKQMIVRDSKQLQVC